MTTYLATADLATIGDDHVLAVDTIVTTGSDGETGIGNTVFDPKIYDDVLPDEWDFLLTAAGFERAGPWQDCEGYWTADVRWVCHPPTTLDTLIAALVALKSLDPVHVAKRTPTLARAATAILGEERDVAVFTVSRGGWGPAATAIGVSQTNINGAVTRQRARLGLT